MSITETGVTGTWDVSVPLDKEELTKYSEDSDLYVNLEETVNKYVIGRSRKIDDILINISLQEVLHNAYEKLTQTFTKSRFPYTRKFLKDLQVSKALYKDTDLKDVLKDLNEDVKFSYICNVGNETTKITVKDGNSTEELVLIPGRQILTYNDINRSYSTKEHTLSNLIVINVLHDFAKYIVEPEYDKLAPETPKFF